MFGEWTETGLDLFRMWRLPASENRPGPESARFINFKQRHVRSNSLLCVFWDGGWGNLKVEDRRGGVRAVEDVVEHEEVRSLTAIVAEIHELRNVRLQTISFNGFLRSLRAW